MAGSKWIGGRTAPTLCADVRRFSQLNNTDRVFGTHTYTAPGFGNWFREQCDAAGCPDVSAHGLRKATARRLAEIGCTAHQIASITCHASLSEVQRYTKAADRKRMAQEAMKKLTEGGW